MATTTHVLSSESLFTTTKAHVGESTHLSSQVCKSNQHRSNLSTASEQFDETATVSLRRAEVPGGRAGKTFHTIEDLPKKDVNLTQRPPTPLRRRTPTPISQTTSRPVRSMMTSSDTTLKGEERAKEGRHCHWNYQDNMHQLHMDWLTKPRTFCHHSSSLNGVSSDPCVNCSQHNRGLEY